MRARFDPTRTRRLAERLVAIPSASPDRAGETRCGRVLLAALPPGIEGGVWRLRDRREVVWGRLRADSGRRSATLAGQRRARGRKRCALLLLDHHDTVGVAEYARLGARGGARLAFQPRRLRERIAELAPAIGGAPELLESLRADLAAGADWMFGRGALDMKSGLAAGVAALDLLAARGADLGGDVLFVSCPDEEHESAGMLAAVGQIARLRDAGKLELLGVINLDYCEGPVGYAGLMGKRLAGVCVIGRPAHAAAPFEGADAAQIAAAIVHHATLSPALAERTEGAAGPPPVALRLRDLKPGYDAQTCAEAVVELNLLSCGRGIEETLEALRQVVRGALDEVAARMDALAPPSRAGAHPARGAPVLTYPELVERAGSAGAEKSRRAAGPAGRRAPRDLRDLSLERVRALARAARLEGPAVVLYLAPPFHPHAPPGTGPLTAAARAVLARAGQELHPFYPFISDASYLSWHAESLEVLARHMPALGAEYRLPAEHSRALDLEVVTLGPWGRDAHSLLERVYAPYAFETLPRLIAEVAAEALRR